MNEKKNTRNITFSAVAAALAAVCIILTNFLPLRISLLTISAVCYYLAFVRCGKVYGFLTIAASILISFFTKPFSSAFFLTVILFAPYSVLAYFLRKLHYINPKTAALRVGIIAVFSSLAFLAAYLLITFLAVAIDFEILALIAKFSYPLMTVAFTMIAIIFDFVFTQAVIRLNKALRF